MPLFKRKTVKKTPSSPASPCSGQRILNNGPAGQGMNQGTEAWGGAEADEGLHPWGASRPKSLLLPISIHEEDTGDLGSVPLKAETPLQTSSRLSKTLTEILHDKDALPQLTKYLQSRGAEHLIRFWLDAESFQASAWTRIRTHSQNQLRKSSVRARLRSDSSSCGDDSVKTVKCNTPSQGHSVQATSCSHPSTEATDTVTMVTGCEGSVPDMLTSLPGDKTNQDVNSPYTSPRPRVTMETNSRLQVMSDFPEDSTKQTTSEWRTSVMTTANNNVNSHVHNVNPGLDSHANTDTTTTTNSVTTITTVSSGSMCNNQDVSRISLNSVLHAESQRGSDFSKEDEFMVKLKRSIERDAVTIYSKYISLDATQPIGITEELRNEAISKICREDGQVDPQCFVSCQEFVVSIIQRDYHDGFMSSEYHCKHQINILTLTGGQVYLADILYNESAFFYFMEFMEQEGASSLLQCWMGIDNFQQHLISQEGAFDAEEAQSDAMVLYDKYFSMQALQPVGFDDKVRFEVEMSICREGGPLPDCFAVPMKIVLKSLEKLYFPNFLTSDIYFRFLSELINTVHNQEIPMAARRRRAGSDASSEHSADSQSTESGSISTKNTLLAAPDPHAHNIKKVLNCTDEDLRIDNVLLNPDALWKRSQSGKMSLGKVNALGQFVSEFDPEPDHEKKKKGTFFKKKKEKEQSQEEMALQIAQMIICDVQSTTQATQDLTDSLNRMTETTTQPLSDSQDHSKSQDHSESQDHAQSQDHTQLQDLSQL